MFQLGQFNDQLWRTWLYVTQARSLAVFFGIGFALLAVTLLIASRTRWGQSKPLTKCVALSVLAHVWLLMYALGSRAILPQGDPHAREQRISVSFESATTEIETRSESEQYSEPLEDQITQASPLSESVNPWEPSVPFADLPRPAALDQVLATTTLALPELLDVPEPTPMPALQPEQLIVDDQTALAPANEVVPPESAINPVDFAPPANAAETPSLAPAAVENNEFPVSRLATSQSSLIPPEMHVSADSSVPLEYQLRQAQNRLQVAASFGADADSEAAVDAGLQWLSESQSPDGSWVAKQFGGGTETNALGESRYGTGDKADTGVSGLALLAFLSAGQTHLEGKHKATVQLGLQFLLRAQMPSGDLSGPKQVGNDRGVLNARMYCHSIATLALAEAHAMTGDIVLRDALLKAAQYSINAQDPRGGGWRYRPRDPGDLSQFGWQAMALKSVERSGIEIPRDVKSRMFQFLESCSAGPAGGLATYKPNEGRPSETMTAESLACRLLLDHPSTLAAQQEALQMIMQHRPGVGEDNVYFWYYATLALFQLQDSNWREWNTSLKRQLLSTQTPNYQPQAGSWPPDKLWGGYGGRVYSTAMSCLCLEVYYRYLPMYQRANLARTPDALRFRR